MNYMKYYSTINVNKVTNQNNNHHSGYTSFSDQIFEQMSNSQPRPLCQFAHLILLVYRCPHTGRKNLEQIDAVFTYPYKIILWLFVSLNQAKAICRLDGVLNSSVHKVNWIKWILLVY